MKKNVIEEICKQYEFWGKLDDNSKQNIISESVIEKYNKGQIIYSPTHKCKGMINIIKGSLRVYMISEDGKEINLYKLNNGDVCTLSALCIMEEIMFDTFMEAEEETEIMVINIFVLKEIMKKNIFLENYMYKQTVIKFSEFMWNLQDVLFTKLDRRLALFLLKQEVSDTVCLTHEQIANQLGSAREVISRILKKFEKEELIELARGKIIIKNKNELKKIL